MPDMDKLILEALLTMCGGEATQEEVAKSLGISQPYLNRLLNRKRPVSGLSLRALMKLFPNARIILNGNGAQPQNSGVNNGVMGVNNGTVNAAGAQSAEAFRDRALKVLMDLDIPSDALLKVLKTIKDLQP